MYNFRVMLESVPCYNNDITPIISAGNKTLEEIVKEGLTLNNQKYQHGFDFKSLFISTDNDQIFKQHGIILEAVNYLAKLIGEIINTPEKTFCPQQLPAKNLFYSTNKLFQNKYKIKKELPVYIIKYNFLTQTKYFFNILKSFKINFDNDYKHAEQILKSFNDAQGIVLPNDNCLFLLLNISSYTIDTICHQLFHCLQIICNIPTNTLPILNTTELIDIPELNLTVGQLKHYFNPKELQTYIQIDFINQCKNVYNTYYLNKTTYQSFILNVLKNIKANPFMVHSCFFANYLKFKPNIINRDLTPITIIAACLILNNKEYLNFILNILEDELK